MPILIFLFGFTLPGVLTQGDPVFYYDARSLGLGGNTTVLENGLNPASICLIDKILFFTGGFIFEQMERRGLRVYDSYGNNIGISTISVAHTRTLNFNPSGFVIPIKFFRAGARYYQIFDFNYQFYHEYRDDFYQIIKIVDNSYTGSLNIIAPLIGLTYKPLSVGLEPGFVFGKVESELRTVLSNDDSISTEIRNLYGNGLSFGIILTPSSHLRFAYFYRGSFQVNGDDTLKYPSFHNFGFYYQPPHRIPTKFVSEINYEFWREPLINYKFGIEHTILYDYFLRYGFSLIPDYNERAIWTTNLTLGLGVRLKNYYFDVGYAYGKRDYSNYDFGGLGIEQKLIFDETQNHFILSFGINL
jgi:hypothetical protein